MKNISIVVILLLLSNIISAQSLNWNSIEQNNSSQVYTNIGYDFGATVQLGYAYKLNFNKPIVLMTDFSIPMGAELNDYKFRIGAQRNIIDRGSFKTSVEYIGVVRRYETNLVRQISIAQMMSITNGWYKDGWHVGIEVGYDSSILSHLKHTEEMQRVYADIQDAWFKNTSAYWYYGLQTSKKIGQRLELNMELGKTNARAQDVDALLPYYFNFGAVVFLN